MMRREKAIIDHLEKNPQRGPMLDTFFPPGGKYTKKIKHGKAVISTVEVSLLESMRSMREPTFFCPPGVYTRLHVGGTLWMSDTPMEMRTQQRFIDAARGRVLIFGLGIGMVLKPVLAKTSVEAAVVVEINDDVRALVGKRFNDPRLVIMDGDATDKDLPGVFKDRGHKFDAIWLDIWSNVSRDNEPEMKRLTALWRPVLAKGGWIGCWGRVEARELG